MAEPPESDDILERYKSCADLLKPMAIQLRRIVGSAVGLDELVSSGREGLLDAAARFDRTRGVPFRYYAYVRIRGAMLDGARSIMPLPRRIWKKLQGVEALNRITASMRDECSRWEPPEEASAADAQLSDYLAALSTAMAAGMMTLDSERSESIPSDDDSVDPERAAIRSELYDRIAAAIEELPHDEAALVRRHYLEGLRFDEVAKQLGLSKSWACRLHRRAIDRLADLLQDEV